MLSHAIEQQTSVSSPMVSTSSKPPFPNMLPQVPSAHSSSSLPVPILGLPPKPSSCLPPPLPPTLVPTVESQKRPLLPQNLTQISESQQIIPTKPSPLPKPMNKAPPMPPGMSKIKLKSSNSNSDSTGTNTPIKKPPLPPPMPPTSFSKLNTKLKNPFTQKLNTSNSQIASLMAKLKQVEKMKAKKEWIGKSIQNDQKMPVVQKPADQVKIGQNQIKLTFNSKTKHQNVLFKKSKSNVEPVSPVFIEKTVDSQMSKILSAKAAAQQLEALKDEQEKERLEAAKSRVEALIAQKPVENVQKSPKKEVESDSGSEQMSDSDSSGSSGGYQYNPKIAQQYTAKNSAAKTAALFKKRSKKKVKAENSVVAKNNVVDENKVQVQENSEKIEIPELSLTIQATTPEYKPRSRNPSGQSKKAEKTPELEDPTTLVQSKTPQSNQPESPRIPTRRKRAKLLPTMVHYSTGLDASREALNISNQMDTSNHLIPQNPQSRVLDRVPDYNLPDYQNIEDNNLQQHIVPEERIYKVVFGKIRFCTRNSVFGLKGLF